MSDDHPVAASGAISWRCRLVQRAMKWAIKPRLTLARGLPAFRRTLERAAMLLPRPPRGITITPASCGGIAGEWTRHAGHTDAAAPVFLYFHGGAFVAGSPRLSRAIVTQLALRCGAGAFSVDYRLAPEHPFPAAIEDAQACYQGLLGMGVAPERIVLAGESAGAALALALAQTIGKDAIGGSSPRALVLISPWLDLTLSGASLRDDPDIDPGLPAGLMGDARDLYVPDGCFEDPLASPLFAPLAGLPPTLIQVGTREILRDDARRLASRMDRAGAPHRLEEWAGMHHVWHHAPFRIPEAECAFAAIARFVAEAGATRSGR
ncbi:MAG: alpha/beta hydrolase [Alphaproteobacteria bacterium]|nr:alpha/beta hydrolase [Alphaproteobacteria bacterium]